MSGCAGSGGSVDAVRDAANVRLSDLPPSVYAEAARVTSIPVERLKAGKLTAADTKALLVALRRSELRKVAALGEAIRQRKREKAYYSKRGR